MYEFYSQSKTFEGPKINPSKKVIDRRCSNSTNSSPSVFDLTNNFKLIFAGELEVNPQDTIQAVKNISTTVTIVWIQGMQVLHFALLTTCTCSDSAAAISD